MSSLGAKNVLLRDKMASLEPKKCTPQSPKTVLLRANKMHSLEPKKCTPWSPKNVLLRAPKMYSLGPEKCPPKEQKMSSLGAKLSASGEKTYTLEKKCPP